MCNPAKGSHPAVKFCLVPTSIFRCVYDRYQISFHGNPFTNRLLSTNGPKNNEKKLRWLVEAIEIHALEERERYIRGKSALSISAQAYVEPEGCWRKAFSLFLGPLVLKGLTFLPGQG